MTATEWAVVAGGIVLIALINWYFFFSERSAEGRAPRGANTRPRATEESQ